jgi:GxxExxY protein
MEKLDLYRELSYQVVGLAMEVHSSYGPNHKEVIYQRALAEKLSIAKVNFQQEPKIAVFSVDTGKQLGWYQPDFLIDDKIIIELKVTSYPLKVHEKQLRDYLKCTKFELGYLLNFGSPSLYYRRIIYTNDLKLRTSV